MSDRPSLGARLLGKLHLNRPKDTPPSDVAHASRKKVTVPTPSVAKAAKRQRNLSQRAQNKAWFRSEWKRLFDLDTVRIKQRILDGEIEAPEAVRQNIVRGVQRAMTPPKKKYPINRPRPEDAERGSTRLMRKSSVGHAVPVDHVGAPGWHQLVVRGPAPTGVRNPSGFTVDVPARMHVVTPCSEVQGPVPGQPSRRERRAAARA